MGRYTYDYLSCARIPSFLLLALRRKAGPDLRKEQERKGKGAVALKNECGSTFLQRRRARSVQGLALGVKFIYATK